MGTLWLTAYTPRIVNGRAIRTYGIVTALSRLGEVEVAYRPFEGDEPAPEYRALPRTTLTCLGAGRGVARGKSYAAARLRGTPHDLARGAAPELTAAARRASPNARIIADGPTVAAALLGIAQKRPFVYCAQNLESAFRHTVPGETLDRGKLERFERKLLDVAAETWMVSDADVAGALELCPTAKVRLVPNVVDARAIEAVTPNPESRRVLFVADLTYGPNRSALEFLRDEVRPQLRALVPGAEIVVVGRGGQTGDEADGLRLLGRVEDLAAEYAAARVVAVPLLQGGGSPLKFVEALAYGLPVVATPKAAAGLAVRPNEHYLEASDGAQFAAQLAAAIEGAGDGMGARGRVLVLERYSIEALTELLRT